MAARTPNCDDRINHPGMRGQCSVTRTPCCMGHQQAGGFEVCEKCHRHSQRLLQIHPAGRVFTHAINQQSPPTGWPGQLVPLTGRNPPWEGFMTRVCSECESRLQGYREVIRTRQLAHPAEMRKWQARGHGGNFNTCTCRWTLGIKHGGPTRCFTHRQGVLNRLIEKKNKNDKWLRDTGVNLTNHIVQATAATKVRRRTIGGRAGGSWRACRCGNDCDASQVAEVLLCMACQGFRSDTHPTGSRHIPLAAADPNPREQFPLGRMRSDLTQ